MEGNRETVAAGLTSLVTESDVVVSADDYWKPCGVPVFKAGYWDCSPADEARIDRDPGFVSPAIQDQLRDWWLADQDNDPKTPTWDLASTCSVAGTPGLVLVEAKAHDNEGFRNRTKAKNPRNRRSIGEAIEEANTALTHITGGRWALSKDNNYQVANRFAWSWKLASFGIPVVLVYLGFLCADEMSDRRKPFISPQDWTRVLNNRFRGIVDEACWGKWLEVDSTPFLPLMRTKKQPL